MVENIGVCLGFIAPYYNLLLVIVVVGMFIRLLTMPKKQVFRRPWEFLFAGICVYIVEEIITVIEMAGYYDFPAFIFPMLETIIITMFIYMLLIQKEHINRL